MADLNQLKTTSEVIRDEIVKEANTATRVGGALVDVSTTLIEQIVETGNIPTGLNGDSVHLKRNGAKYWGSFTKVEPGLVDRIEIPYFEADFSGGAGYAYYIILDQSDTVLAYKRINADAVTFASTEGTFVLELDNDLSVTAASYLQIVVGFKDFNNSDVTCKVYSHRLASSSDRNWVSTDALLDVDDTSAVDWSAIKRNPASEIIQGLSYKLQA